MDKVRLIFSKQAAKARARKKLSPFEAAMALNMSPENYRRLESGKQSCKYETVVQLATFLDVSLDELFGFKSAGQTLEPNEELLLAHYQKMNLENRKAVDAIVRAVFLNQPSADFLNNLVPLIASASKKIKS